MPSKRADQFAAVFGTRANFDISGGLAGVPAFPGGRLTVAVPGERDDGSRSCDPGHDQPGQHGTVTLRYIPDKLCLELKSLKMYALAQKEMTGHLPARVELRFLGIGVDEHHARSRARTNERTHAIIRSAFHRSPGW